METEIIHAYLHIRRDYVTRGAVDGMSFHHKLPAKAALRYARRTVQIQSAWDEAGDNVRLRTEPDYYFDFDQNFGDTFDAEVNSDINPNVIEKQEKALKKQIANEGVWTLIGEYRCSHCGSWIQADQLSGIIGENYMDTDMEIMDATLREYHEYKD